MTDRRLIVLSLDGLATSALGCYGSSWNSTPAIDSLAAAGALWDRWTATSDDPLELLSGWLGAGRADWMSPWRSGGAVELLTDDRRLIDRGLGEHFDEAWLVEPEAEGEAAWPAEDPAETQFGRLIASATERSAEGNHPWSVLWLHSQFLVRQWDAPRGLFPVDPIETELEEGPSEEVELLAEPWQETDDVEQEPPPLFDTVEPPRFELGEARHPDLVTSWMRTYGCQIRLIDLLLDVLRESLAPLDPVVVVTSTGGFNLGQNGWIGPRCGPLRSSEVRLPLIVGAGPPIRSPRLTATDRLPEILAALREADRPLVSPQQWSESDSEFEPAVSTDARGGQPAVTTARWFWVRDNELDEHLFLKPDDADDVNDVHRLSPDAVEQLERLAETS